MSDEAASIVSLVSSIDNSAARFIGQARSQLARKEVISDLADLTSNAILSFKNGPIKRILYYRDGVGENQFEEIREVELAAIRAACKKQNISPQITIVICQKRTL